MSLNIRNTLKGYLYQQQIFTFFVAKMDCDRDIEYVEAEIKADHNFDDILVVKDGVKYFFQAKNYNNVTSHSIRIFDDHVMLSGKRCNISIDGINILIINTDNIDTNSEILGLSAYKSNNVYIIPFSENKIIKSLDDMYNDEIRPYHIIKFADSKIVNSNFKIIIDDLPQLNTYSTKLEQETFFAREIINISKGILCIEGKPGVGKSHFVNELNKEYGNAIVYRFWISSQDINYNERLLFKNFILDLKLKILKTYKRTTDEELISKINESSPIIFIDGLDHISNYNHSELSKYIEFINKIQNAKVLVFTRPLHEISNWNKIELGNWSREQTINYLRDIYDLDYANSSKIYGVTKGYPIITSYLAQHYKQNRIIGITSEINDINEYYSAIVQNIQVCNTITIFLLNNSYFTKNELKTLPNSEMISEIIIEFIDNYPYLFSKHCNRYSLFHDSFNTYLRNNKVIPDSFKTQIIETVKNSIRNMDIEYLSRISYFDFDDDFKKEILLSYSDFNVMTNLFSKYYDYGSIKEFYLQLKSMLEYYPDLFDIYQYYSLILITEIISRDNETGNNILFIQFNTYLISHGIDENQIYSNGMLWSVFSLIKSHDIQPLTEFIQNMNISNINLDNFKNDFNNEKCYFSLIDSPQNIDEILDVIRKSEYIVFKIDKLISLLSAVYANKILDSKLYPVIEEYVRINPVDPFTDKLKDLCLDLGIDLGWYSTASILKNTKERLFSLGKLREENPLLNNNFDNFIDIVTKSDSFNACERIEKYIRLANREKREINIKCIWKYFLMYHAHKDYSVITLPESLIIFEKHGLIDKSTSIKIITNVMNQSERGIRHLLTEYINCNDNDVINTCIECGIFEDRVIPNLNDLCIDKINIIEYKHIEKKIFQLIYRNKQSNTINFNNINNLIQSKYKQSIFSCFKCFKIIISDVPKEHINLVSDYGYYIEEQKDFVDKVHEPFYGGYISNDDIPYVISQNLSYMDVASYTNDYWECLPYLEVYNHFNPEDLRKDFLKIIHTSLYTKIRTFDEFGYWRRYLGNIPQLMDIINYEVDWERLFEIFMSFISVSNISVE